MFSLGAAPLNISLIASARLRAPPGLPPRHSFREYWSSMHSTSLFSSGWVEQTFFHVAGRQFSPERKLLATTAIAVLPNSVFRPRLANTDIRDSYWLKANS